MPEDLTLAAGSQLLRKERQRRMPQLSEVEGLGFRVLAGVACILLASAFCLWCFLRLPIFQGDEYAYLAVGEARRWGFNSRVIDPGLQQVNAPLYMSFIALLQSLFAEPYLVLKASNFAIFLGGVAIFVGSLASGSRRVWSLAMICAATPFLVFIFSSMAEGMFFGLIAAALGVFASGLTRLPALSSAACGFLLG